MLEQSSTSTRRYRRQQRKFAQKETKVTKGSCGKPFSGMASEPQPCLNQFNSEQRSTRPRGPRVCATMDHQVSKIPTLSSLPSVDHRRPSPGQRDCSQKDRRHRRQQRRSEQKETNLAKVRHLASGTLFLRARPSPSLD